MNQMKTFIGIISILQIFIFIIEVHLRCTLQNFYD